jgi:hypothetical protein
MSLTTICWQGNTYVFHKMDKTETDEHFRDRVWWIVKNLDKASLEHLVNMSYIWSNVVHLKTRYDTKIMGELDTYRPVYS